MSLAMYTSEKHDDWDTFIPAVLFAYRVSPATSSTRHSPFFLLHGRHPRLPIDTALLVSAEALKTASEHLQDILPQLEKYHQVAHDNIKIARDKMLKYYNKNARQPKFEIGDHVWVYTPRLKISRSKKLLHHWHGPMYLVQKITPVTFRVRNAKNMLIKGPVHVNRMKQFIHRNDRPITPINDDDPENDLEEEDIPDDSWDTDSASTDIEQNNDIYTVEKILDSRRRNRETQYLIRWKNFGPEHDSWEPEKNILDKSCIQIFDKNRAHKRKGRPSKS